MEILKRFKEIISEKNEVFQTRSPMIKKVRITSDEIQKYQSWSYFKVILKQSLISLKAVMN